MFGKGGNDRGIVSMTDRERAKRIAPLRMVETYWLGLCGEDKVPLRSQVDPRGMESALENAFLMERIAPGMAKIRVAGSHLSDLMGMQMAGMPFSSLIAPTDRERIGEAVKSLFSDPAVVRIRLRGENGFGKPEIEGDMILLPLRSDFGDVTRCLGALVTHGRIGRTPRRFEVASIEVCDALSAGTGADLQSPHAVKLDPTPARGAPKPVDSRVKGMSEAQKPFVGKGKVSPAVSSAPNAPAAPKDGKKPRGSHLRIVVSND